MTRVTSVSRRAERTQSRAPGAPELGNWAEFYETHFEFIWRSLRRLGVPESSVDDAAQEVFLVVFRRLETFEGRSSLKTWLFGVALRVARRFAQRLRSDQSDELSDSLVDSETLGQEDSLARSEAVRTLYAILSRFDHEKRAVFVMSELEQMTAPEIAELSGTTLNTVYSRLRAARRDFDAALKRLHAHDDWRGS
jgi:RNA polymerase sigma-70 factor (ECF subfamily)